MLRLHEYRYHRPRALREALDLLAQEGALPISGGTDLVPNMKHRLWTPEHLVALGRLPELRGVGWVDEGGTTCAEADAAGLAIGAATTLSEVAAYPLVRRSYPALATAAGAVAHPQIRNRGTLGGNLCLDTRCTYYNQSWFWRQALGFCLKKDGDVCHVTKVGKKCVAAHSADTPPVLIALGAEVDLVSAEGERTVTVEDFFIADGSWNQVRRPEEIVVRVRIPRPPPGQRSGYLKVRQRNAVDFPLLSIALVAELEPDSTVQAMSLVVSGLGARPRTVSGLAGVAVGKPLEEVGEAVAQQALKQSHPLENMIVDTDWRRAMVLVHVRRLIGQLAAVENGGAGLTPTR
ncbi:xanthine dehydrogenase family protein subunit M [soil metagenome]